MAKPSTAMPRQARNSPVAPSAMIPNSHNLTIRMIRALSRISASCPAIAEKTTKGIMNSAEAMPENIDSLSSEL